MKEFRRQIRYDLKSGFMAAWKKWIPLILIIIFFCIMYDKRILLERISKGGTEYPGYFDYMIYLMKGMYPPTGIEDKEFYISAVWLILNGYLVLAISWYPYKDYQISGYQSLLRAGTKDRWWYSKCIWVAATALMYYIVIGVSVLLYSLVAHGNMTAGPIINIGLSDVDTSAVSGFDLCILLFLIPWLASISISMIQMLFSLAAGPVIGIVMSVAILTASAYFVSPVLTGNMTMLLRSTLISSYGGISPFHGILSSVIILIVSIVAGRLILNRRDVLKKEIG